MTVVKTLVTVSQTLKDSVYYIILVLLSDIKLNMACRNPIGISIWILLLILAVDLVTSAPAPARRFLSTEHFNDTNRDQNQINHAISILNGRDGPPLRILPLGASITWGRLSSTGNGSVFLIPRMSLRQYSSS